MAQDVSFFGRTKTLNKKGKSFEADWIYSLNCIEMANGRN